MSDHDDSTCGVSGVELVKHRLEITNLSSERGMASRSVCWLAFTNSGFIEPKTFDPTTSKSVSKIEIWGIGRTICSAISVNWTTSSHNYHKN